MQVLSRKLVCFCLLLTFMFAAQLACAEAAKININTAEVAELVTLKGIGEKTAAGIIAYREANGPFKAITELTKVKGVGEKTFAKISDQITIGEKKTK
ncbi:MAG: helix-hairpin-helix domain-containing protein [Deltaproteobacteria bacterium]|nr:helix-hairpin-helix domain-containing protein [Deltaproteobacteria bacterium]